jgi:hypothetical protein
MTRWSDAADQDAAGIVFVSDVTSSRSRRTILTGQIRVILPADASIELASLVLGSSSVVRDRT